jgi:hypothetical protein
VKAFNRKMFASFLMVGMLGFAGCGPDNETDGQKLSTKIGDPGKANPDSVPKDQKALPKTAADRAAQGPQGTQQSSGYPGAGAKK